MPVPRVGFLGLGTMGRPMASNLLKAGFPVTVWNRTSSRMKPLQDLGATGGCDPAQVASTSDVVITMVSTPKDVEELALGPDGAVHGLRRGSVLIDMSTVSPETSLKLAAEANKKSADFLDAPVVGSKGPATEGTLAILVGGSAAVLDRCRPVLAAMGKTIIHAGDHGKGSALKLATNLMLAHLAAGFSEGLLLVQRAGIDPQRYLDVLQASPFHTPWYASKGVGMIKRDFSTHFALKHMAKDVRLMNQLAASNNLSLPITQAIEALFAQSEAAGRAEQDYSAILDQIDHADHASKR